MSESSEPATADERWGRFLTRFFSALIVWKAQDAHQPSAQLGFHDDAFGSYLLQLRTTLPTS